MDVVNSVKLKIKVAREQEDLVDLNIQVTDSGIGISQDKLSMIFDSFSQAHNNNATKYFGGTGLGLSITRKITELMQGEITAESELGAGSKFNVRLTFRRGEILPVRNSIHNDIPFSLKGYSVIVAEDILANQLLLKHLLTKWEADFIICNNGQEVLSTLQHRSFDLMLMDLQMPVMDGMTTIKIIRNSFRHLDSVPIVAFTADTFAQTTQVIMDCKFNDFVTKPFKIDELTSVIRKQLLL